MSNSDNKTAAASQPAPKKRSRSSGSAKAASTAADSAQTTAEVKKPATGTRSKPLHDDAYQSGRRVWPD